MNAGHEGIFVRIWGYERRRECHMPYDLWCMMNDDAIDDRRYFIFLFLSISMAVRSHFAHFTLHTSHFTSPLGIGIREMIYSLWIWFGIVVVVVVVVVTYYSFIPPPPLLWKLKVFVLCLCRQYLIALCFVRSLTASDMAMQSTLRSEVWASDVARDARDKRSVC